jgi:hypothetical protein
MPLFAARLSETTSQQRKLSIAQEVASKIGYPEIRGLKRVAEERLIFETALIVLLSFRYDILDIARINPYGNLSELLAIYPVFTGLDNEELYKLLEFANFMKVSLLLLPAKGKKAHLLDLVTRITEGKHAKYVCGGGMGFHLVVMCYARLIITFRTNPCHK